MTEIDPAVARKRRKAIIQSQRSEAEHGNVASNVNADNVGVPAPPEETDSTQTSKHKAGASIATTVDLKANADDVGEVPTVSSSSGGKKRKQKKLSPAPPPPDSASSSDEGKERKKTQIKYEPDVPMNKEQLAAWRREARRVRNRESAAASRQRIRNRITELEDEVGEWKSKYTEAMERLKFLEKQQTTANSTES